MTAHDYTLEVQWKGNTGEGYRAYSREFRIAGSGKPVLVGSAAPAFRGDAERYNPEELLVAALGSCHMLSYLALCARAGLRVNAYVDTAHGRMIEGDHGGQFEEVVLSPRVVIAEGADRDLALALHDQAHAECYIARSCNFRVRHQASIVPPRRDLAIRLADRPGALAELGETLGRAGISVEGGGGFVVGDGCVVHFLVGDAERASAALRDAGIEVVAVRDVVVQRLDQVAAGQLGSISRAMAEAGVNIEVVYSDHDNQLILAVDDLEAARRVSNAWSA